MFAALALASSSESQAAVRTASAAACLTGERQSVAFAGVGDRYSPGYSGSLAYAWNAAAAGGLSFVWTGWAVTPLRMIVSGSVHQVEDPCGSLRTLGAKLSAHIGCPCSGWRRASLRSACAALPRSQKPSAPNGPGGTVGLKSVPAWMSPTPQDMRPTAPRWLAVGLPVTLLE
jgi:hypothetical protein